MRREGLTLIEVLIAMAFIGIVFAALAALQIGNLRITRAATLETARLEVALEQFESIKRSIEGNFDTFKSDCTVASPPPKCTVSDSEGRFEWEASISGDTIDEDGLVSVVVLVSDSLGSITFRQYVSCLDVATGDRPSVFSPGACTEGGS